jgi:Flp pilus assembly protein TadD
MLRKPIAVLLVVVGLRLGAVATPEGSLELGLRAFRAGDYASAVVDLGAAASVSSTDWQTYVARRQMDRLQSFEMALVYLALAQFRLGGEDEAHQTILRLLEAERIVPLYAGLPLQSDAAEFETLVNALVPASGLPANGQIAASDAMLPLPAVTPAAAPQPPATTQPAPVAAAPPQATAPPPTTQPQPVARISTDDDGAAVRAALNSLRQAQALADDGELDDANAIYTRLAVSSPREIVAAAAVGLYRTGAYRDAVQGFRRLGTFGRGEEDLHYYFAVALYEAGEYEAARKELLCALPYIELTDEVARYRAKIEQSAAVVSTSHS